MSKRELIGRDVDRLLAFLKSLRDEPPLKVGHASDWLTPEDEAWAEL